MQLDIGRALKSPGIEFEFALEEARAPESWHGDELVFVFRIFRVDFDAGLSVF